jgi:undecaprenyl-diphosphatase
MNLWEIILYSFIQGVTEFLPISSSAHLFLLENIFNWPVSGRTMAIAAHLGTLIAVIFFLRKDIAEIFTSLNKIKDHKINKNIILFRNLIIITIPILMIGLFIFKNLDKQLLLLNIVAWSSLIGGILLYICDKYRNEERDIYSLSILDSLFIGFFQIFALIPGASRAGSIITASRILKLTRIESTKLGLYSGIPTIAGAVILELFWLINNALNKQEFLFIAITGILSFIFAYLSILFLIRWLQNYTFIPFVIYRIILGLILLYLINT